MSAIYRGESLALTENERALLERPRSLDLTEARRLGRAVRGLAGKGSPSETLQRLGEIINFRVIDLEMEVDEDGVPGFVLSRDEGGFAIAVAPQPRLKDIDRPTPRRVPRPLARSFVIGHEVGHTLFFNQSVIPHRRWRRSTEAEEEFCDEFAMTLIGKKTQR